MSLLGTVVRVRTEQLDDIATRLGHQPGVDVAANPGDGRLVVLIEDVPGCVASETMAAIALLPGVLGVSLVYEYSGPDLDDPAPADAGAAADTAASPQSHAATSWRLGLHEMARDTRIA